MDILSKTPERLKELMFDKEINAPALAKAIGVKSNTITRYLQGFCLPTFQTFIKLTDYFHCSADFLLGLQDDPNYDANFLTPPPFSQAFKTALKVCNFSQYALQKQTGISWANFHYWLNDIRLPYVDSLVKIARTMDISVDYLLGRVQ